MFSIWVRFVEFINAIIFHQPTAFLDAICIPCWGSRVSSLPKKPSKAKQLGKIRSFKDWLKSSPSLGWSNPFPIDGNTIGGWPAILRVCHFLLKMGVLCQLLLVCVTLPRGKNFSCYTPDLWWWPKSQSCPRDVRLSKLGGNATLSKGPWLTQAIFFIRCGGPFPFQFLQQKNWSYSRPKKMWVINWHPFEKIKICSTSLEISTKYRLKLYPKCNSTSSSGKVTPRAKSGAANLNRIGSPIPTPKIKLARGFINSPKNTMNAC